MPLVFPGIVLGVAMMELCCARRCRSTARCGSSRSGSPSATCRTACATPIPGCCRSIANWRRRRASPGAGPIGVLRRIVVPLLSPALLSGWLFIFLIAAKELSMAVLLAGPGSQTMAVAMFDLWANGQGGELAALGLLWALLMTLFAAVFYVLARRGSSSAYRTMTHADTPCASTHVRAGAEQGRIRARTARPAGCATPASCWSPARSSRCSGRAAAARRRRCAASPGWRRRIAGGSRWGSRCSSTRPRGIERAAEPAQHRDGVPVLRHLAAHDGVRERRLPAAGREGGAATTAAAIQRMVGQALETVSLAGFQDRSGDAALGRPAAAGGAGAGDRASAAPAAAGRAAEQPGRGAAGGHADRAEAPAAADRRDDDLRDARPVGGAGHVATGSR